MVCFPSLSHESLFKKESAMHPIERHLLEHFAHHPTLTTFLREGGERTYFEVSPHGPAPLHAHSGARVCSVLRRLERAGRIRREGPSVRIDPSEYVVTWIAQLG
jgi:hypothetical protein